ncbi:MAG: hypothetical protein J6Z17_01255, partial [Treponema sp.]|nr:hypothetical protein [Treponema sp.]
MSKIFKKLVLSAAATAGAIIWLSTCDIGLGSSVDTQAPSLTIENPVSSVVYRDEIPVNGTWSDDKGVTRIDISLTNISTDTKLPDIYTAEITDTKSWNFKLHSGRSVNVSEDGVVLPDGKYEVNVTAYDASGHTSGTRSRSFTVDSTPPVFVITKPNSTNINDPAVYGRTVQITGKISEDNSVKSMKVRIFRVNADGTAGEEVNLIKNEFTDFDPLDTMVTVAKYFEKTEGIEYSEEELELYENYKKLYGVKGDDVFDTTQKYYTVITLKDNAGNESDKTYIGSFLDKALTEAIGKKLESSDIKNILNGSTDGGIKGRNKEEKLKLAKIILAGTVSDDEDEATKSRAEAIFSKYNYLATESKKLAFSVVSRANPTYSMSSEFKAKPVLDSLSEVLPDGVLTINVNSGLDNDAITPSGITITIYEIDGETGKTITGKDENGNDSFITITGENIYNSNDQKISESQTATNAATYRVKLEDFKERFKRGAYYCLKLSGKDDNENEFIPKDEVPAGMKDTIVYAFQIQRDNVVPTVKFYGHTDGDYVKATDFASSENGKLTFRVAAKSGAEMTVTSCVSVFEGIKTEFDEKNDFTGEVQSQILPAQKVNAGSAQTVEVPVKINNLEEKNYTLAIKVCAQITNGNSAIEVFYVHADNKAPEFEVTNTELKKTRIIITEQDENSVSKTESENGFEYYYTVNGKWSDIEGSGTGSIEYRFRGSGQNDFGSWIRLSEDEAVQTQRTMRWEKTFKIEGGEGKNIALDYRACDQAGNETGIKSFENIIFDFAAPEVKLSEGTLPLEKYYGKNSSPVLSLTASDSNELKSVIVEVKKDGVLLEGDGLEANGVTVTNAALAEGEKSHGVSVNLTNDGVYQVKVTTSDIAERISEYTAQTTIDGTAPVIKGTITLDDESLNENKYYGGKRWLVKGSYTESVLLDKIFYYLKKPDDSTDVTSFADLSKVDNVQQIVPDDENISAGEYGFEVNLAFDDNKDGKANILYIQARDKAGNLSQISSYTVNIDTAPPALALKTEDLNSAYKKDSSAAVTLTAKDENALSKINVSISKKNDAGAYVALTDNELSEIVTRDPINSGITKSADVTVTFSTDGTKDGEYKIDISAEDPAGVPSNSYTREVLIDGTLPFLIEPLKIEDAPYSSSYYDSTRLSVLGNYNEKNLKSVYYYIKKIGDTTVINEDSELTSYSKISIAEGTSFEKTLEFENNRNGAGDTLYIQAEDKAGNLSPVTSYAVNVDNEAPSLSGSILNSSYAYSTQNPVLTLTASDTNALSDVSVTVFKKINGSYVELAESELIPNGITVDKGTEPISGKTTAAVTVSFTADGTKDGEYKVLATALDARGNTSPKAERETVIDGTSPVINGSALKIGTALYNEQSFYGDTKINVSGEYTDTALSSVWCYVRKTGETADANAASELSKVTGAKEVTVFETTETGIQFTVQALDFADNKNDGANTLYIQARDKAGNLSSVSTYTVNIDTLNPTVNVNGTALASSYKENESVALALTASDDNALNAVTVIVEKKNSSGGYDDASDAVIVTQDSITAGTKSVNVNIAFKDTGVADGEYRISALASDVAGHSSTYTASTLIDRTKPVVNDNTLKINNTAYSASSYFGSKTLTVKGDCTEAAALASVYCYVKKPGEETTVTSPLYALTGVKTVTPEGVSFTESTLSFIDNTASAANILYVQAEDKAGNLSEIKSYVINVDTVSPSVTVKENTQALSSSYSRTNEAVTLTLTAKDTEGPLSSVSVKVLKKGTDGTYSEIAQSDLESNGVSISNESISSGARTHEVSVSFTGNGTNVNYDGDYKVQVTASDTVGHAFDYEAATVIDGTLPSLVNGIKIEGEVPSSSKYFDRTNLAVTGEYSEPLSTLYYYVKKAGDTASINSSTVLSGLTDVKTVTSFENSVKFEKSIAFEKNVSGSGCMLYLQAKDKAGNLSAITSYIVNVDDQTPVLTGSGLSSSYAYSTQNPVLTLTASDTNALSDVTVVVSKKADGGSYAAIAEADLASNGITVNKGTEPILGKTVAAVTVSFTADGTKDGEYKVLATASDAAGNTSSAVEKETVIDGTKPVISSVKLDDSALSETNYYGSKRPSLSGTYTEAMALDKVYCYVKKPGDTVSVTSPLSEVTGVRTITPSDNSFEDDSLVFGDNTESGANTVYLQAKDKAGNLSELASYTVNVDTVAPALTGALLGTYHKKGSAAGVTLTASDANALKNVRAEVFAADADGNYGEALDTAALEAKGVTVTNENFAPGTKRSHQVSVVFNTDGNHDGKFKVRVSAEDVADRTSTVYESETVIDGTLPVNTGNLLVNGDVYNRTTYSENSKISVSGAYTDSSLIKTVYYLVKKTGETKLTCNENTVLSEISGYKTAVIEGDSFETPNIEFANNTKNDWNVIYIQAEDRAGNLSAVSEYKINVDNVAPHLVVVGNGLADYYKYGQAPSLTLHASDTNKLQTIHLRFFEKNGAGYVELAPEQYAGMGVSVERTTVTDTTNLTISINSITGTNDGEYKLEAWAEDVAGKTSDVYTASTVIDGTIPSEVAGSLEVEGTPYAADKFSSLTKLSVAGKYTDANLEAVYGYVTKTGDSDDMSSVTNLSTATLSGTLKTVTTFTQEADGLKFELPSLEFKNNTATQANTLYIQAKDKAGNFSEIKTYTINIDATPAKLLFKAYKTEEGTLTEASGTAYVNGTNSITVYGEYNDEVSGVEGLTLLKDGEAYSGDAEIKYSTTAITDTASAGTINNWKVYSAGDSKDIKSFKVTFTPTEGGSLTMNGRNGADVSGDSSGSLVLIVDSEAPSITSGLYYANADTGARGSVLFSKEDKYYTNPAGKYYTVAGNLSDNYSLDRAEFIINEGSTEEIKKIAKYDKATGSLLIEKFQLTGLAKVDSAVLTVYDKAGNSSTENFTVVFDTTGPSGYHEIDAKSKDLYFRIGGADNDDIAQDNSLWDAALDEDAGKKYGEGTYGKDTLIRVRGNITDEGSGVATIYYYVFDKEIKFEGNSTTPVVSGEYWTIKDTNSLRDYVVAAGSTNTNIHGGSFAPLVTPVTKRVFYNVDENDVDVHGDVIHDPTNPTGAADKKGTKLDNSLSDGYWKFYKNVKHTYDYKISGFDNPKNYLVIVAEDNIGNRSLDYADVYDEQEQGLIRKYFCAINYDNVLPVLTADESSGEVKYVNTKEENGNVVFMNGTDVTLSGTAMDADSKLREISLEVNGYEVTETENDYGVITKTENGNTWNWTATLKASAFHGASGTVVVNAKAVDNAGDGNSSTMPVGTVMIDSRVPTVTLNVPADADSNSEGIQVNKKISFNGSANDNTTLPSDCVTKIQYSEKTEGWTQENAVWTDYEDNSGSYSVSGSYSFNVTDFNTELSGIKDKTYYEVRAVAHDVAGNTGYSDPVEIYVSQDSDRPIINLTNLTLQDTTSYLKSTTRLEGTVSDDDGAVSSVKYSTDGTSWNSVTLTGSAWNIPGLDEGDNTIYFMVTDAKGTTFTTAVAGAEGATEATQPKVKDEAGSYVAVNDGSL